MNLYAYCGNNPINCTDPDGRDPLLGAIYGINTAAQAAVYGAGGTFLTTIGVVGTLAVPDPSDIALTAAVAKLVSGGQRLRRIARVGDTGADFYSIGKKLPDRHELEIGHFFASQGDEVFMIGRRLEGLPDLRINGRWWEAKSIRQGSFSNGVRRSLSEVANGYIADSSRVNRMVLDVRASGHRTGDVFREIKGQIGANPTWRSIDELIVIGTNGAQTVNPWRF